MICFFVFLLTSVFRHTDLAARMGVEDAFTEGKSTDDWLSEI